MSILRRLDDFRGASRFTTWAYKFALLEAAVKLRKRAWQGREIPLEPETWDTVFERRARARRRGGAERAARDVAGRDQRGADAAPAPRARRACAERRPDRRARRTAETNRGALYKTLHDARRKLRKHLDERGLAPDDWLEEELMERPDLEQALGRLLGPAARRSAATPASTSSTATSSSRSRAPTPTRASPGCARISKAARPAARSTTACSRSSAATIVSRRRRSARHVAAFDARCASGRKGGGAAEAAPPRCSNRLAGRGPRR